MLIESGEVGMKMFERRHLLFFIFTALFASIATLPVHAETPLSLSVSETLTYDSNMLKDDRNKRRDLKSNTGIIVGFDKDYGRQNYSASVLAVAERFKNLKEYDNDGYKVNLGFSSGIASNGQVALRADRTRQLQDFTDQGLARYVETIESSNVSLTGTYGLYGRWSVNATGNAGEARYKRNDEYDKDYQGLRLGVRYSPTDLLYFDAGVKKLKVDSDKLPLLYLNRIGEKIDRSDVDFGVNWTVTGFSSLYARIAWSKEDHLPDDKRSFDGLTGRLSWQYTPRGKVVYNLMLERDTNNEGGFSNVNFGSVVTGTAFDQAQNRLTTGGTLSATWQATSKISASGSLTYRRLEEDSTITTQTQIIDRSSKANYRSVGVGLRYSPSRSWSFDCNLELYNRGALAFSAPYSGQAVSCSGALLID